MATPWTWTAGGDVAEKLDFLTDVMQAKLGGKEQRRKLRLGPRILQQFEGMEEADRRRQMEHALAMNGGDTWDVPLVQDAAELEGDVTGAVVPADTTFRRFAEGGRVLLINDDPRTFDVGVIASLDDESITLEDDPALVWGAGARVIPLVEGRIETVPTLSRFTGDVAPYQVSFQLVEPVDWPEDFGDAVYRDLPVFEWQPDWTRDPDWTPERGMGMVDNETGLPSWYDQAGIPLARLNLSVTARGRPEIAELRSLVYAMAGRFASVWVPSQARDLVLAAGLASGSAVMDVTWTGLSAWDLQENRRDVRIQLASGAVLYRRITAAVELSPGVERLTLDANHGVTVTAAQVVLVSFMALCRQEADVNVLRFWKRETVQTELGFRGFAHGL